MEAFIRTKLQPTDTCIICSDPFNDSHLPVALPCHHIFGHACIKTWLRDGRGNTNSCPCCRQEIYTANNAAPVFTDAAIWSALRAQSPEHIHNFMSALWARIQKLFEKQPAGNFDVSELLDRAVIPALSRTARDHNNRGPWSDAHGLVLSTWNSLGRPNSATGLAIPLVRLARLMTQTSATLPKWITTVQRTSVLFWRANACLGTTSLSISWAHLTEASQLAIPRYFPFLHLYTVLLSQHIVHVQPTHTGPSREQVLERCFAKIGGDFEGRPRLAFKDAVVEVYEQLRRHQLEEKRLSLRGHDEEKGVVTGLWAMAAWRREEGARRLSMDGGPLRRKVSGGWSD